MILLHPVEVQEDQAGQVLLLLTALCDSVLGLEDGVVHR